MGPRQNRRRQTLRKPEPCVRDGNCEVDDRGANALTRRRGSGKTLLEHLLLGEASLVQELECVLDHGGRPAQVGVEVGSSVKLR